MPEPHPERLVTTQDQANVWTAEEAAELTRALRFGSWEERQKANRIMDAMDRKMRRAGR